MFTKILPGEPHVDVLVPGPGTEHERHVQRLPPAPPAAPPPLQTARHHEQEHDAQGRHQGVLGILFIARQLRQAVSVLKVGP